MTKHDQKRKDKLLQTLKKAANELADYQLYLKDEDREAIWGSTIVGEHIHIAIDRLSSPNTLLGGR